MEPVEQTTSRGTKMPAYRIRWRDSERPEIVLQHMLIADPDPTPPPEGVSLVPPAPKKGAAPERCCRPAFGRAFWCPVVVLVPRRVSAGLCSAAPAPQPVAGHRAPIKTKFSAFSASSM